MSKAEVLEYLSTHVSADDEIEAKITDAINYQYIENHVSSEKWKEWVAQLRVRNPRIGPVPSINRD